MAYTDQHSRFRLKPVAGVALVHLAIGYAFISGLASNVITNLPTVIKLINIPAVTPPPPNLPDPPKAEPAQPRTAAIVEPQVKLPPLPQVDPVIAEPVLPDVTFRETVTPPKLVPPPPATSRATSATAKGDRTGWITTGDYPARALRNGEEGTVGIRVRIGGDGRVSECTVTASSGSAALDDATCRLYQRRARFSPALDDAGQAVATTINDRIRWTIPQ